MNKFFCKIIYVFFISAVLFSCTVTGFCAEKSEPDSFDISKGCISVYSKAGNVFILQNGKEKLYDRAVKFVGSSMENNIEITLDSKEKTELNIVFDGLSIDVSEKENAAAVKIVCKNNNKVNIITASETVLKSGKDCAGIDIENTDNGETEFCDEKDDIKGYGKLFVHGGRRGAGIGGGYNKSLRNVIISGGNIEAKNGETAAGLGGGGYGNCENIEITGGSLIAGGGEASNNLTCLGAGIGGGFMGQCKNLHISGGFCVGIGYYFSPGIGGGCGANSEDIIIDGGNVLASGRNSDYASIGNSFYSNKADKNIKVDKSCFIVPDEKKTTDFVYIINGVLLLAVICKIIYDCIKKSKRGEKGD